MCGIWVTCDLINEYVLLCMGHGHIQSHIGHTVTFNPNRSHCHIQSHSVTFNPNRSHCHIQSQSVTQSHSVTSGHTVKFSRNQSYSHIQSQSVTLSHSIAIGHTVTFSHNRSHGHTDSYPVILCRVYRIEDRKNEVSLYIIDVANVQNVLYNFWKEGVLLRSFQYYF